MPGVYVFPGGCVEPGDLTAVATAAADDLRPDVLARLRRRCSTRRARAFAHAALRETMEETGLVAADGIVGHLDYIARARTPPTREQRFDTRFFLADAALFVGELRHDGELGDLAWRRPREAEALPMACVTRFVLRQAVRLWARPPAPDPNRPAPFFTMRGERPRVVYE
jgi:8-oxo-dGTP pyrophosphatase MutT (NUDIX family)